MKPHVICHMLSPLDGRLLLDPWAPSGSQERDEILGEYQRLHNAFEPDAWLVGANTMEDFATGASPPVSDAGSQAPRPWHVAEPEASRFAVAIDRRSRLHWKSGTADDGHVVVVLPSSVQDAHLRELVAAGVSYLVMPGTDIDLEAMLVELHERLGIRKLLLEGGGVFNGVFLKAGLVDEISLLLWPAIDGSSGSAAIFETGDVSVGPRLKLELKAATPLKSGGVHLQYDVSSRSP